MLQLPVLQQGEMRRQLRRLAQPLLLQPDEARLHKMRVASDRPLLLAVAELWQLRHLAHP